MRNQKGITLIALVVTIVVLLILAGTSIAMLTGDNGIITNAQKSQAANTEGEVVDKMGLAYNTLNTEARIKMSTDNGYQPSAEANTKALAALVASELGATAPTAASEATDPITDGKYHVTYTVNATDKTSQIVIVYGDSKFALASSTAEGSNNLYPCMKATINLTTTGASYSVTSRKVK